MLKIEKCILVKRMLKFFFLFPNDIGLFLNNVFFLKLSLLGLFLKPNFIPFYYFFTISLFCDGKMQKIKYIVIVY